MSTIKSYTELIKLNSFKDRFEYLSIKSIVGDETFGHNRYLNQIFYKSREWYDARREVLIRDNGCDLGIADRQIVGKILIHHMNPISSIDILNRNSDIWNPEFLISVSHTTHNAIHYGDFSLVENDIIERYPGDTKLW